jgi:hypothetical protein
VRQRGEEKGAKGRLEHSLEQSLQKRCRSGWHTPARCLCHMQP